MIIMSFCQNETVSMELEALKAIYLDDIQVKSEMNDDDANHIEVNVLPSTAENKTQQHVRLSLNIRLPPKYPNELPSFEIRYARGLNDDTLDKILCNIKSIAESRCGDTMLFDVIEATKDFVTSYNFPQGNRCSICLYDFTLQDDFYKTECFHYLHSRCLAEYVSSVKNSFIEETQTNVNDGCDKMVIDCPVCRTQINIEGINDPNKFSFPYLSNEPLVDENALIEEAKDNVKRFNDIYQKQQQQGGIIDETLRNKLVLRISQLDNNESAS